MGHNQSTNIHIYGDTDNIYASSPKDLIKLYLKSSHEWHKLLKVVHSKFT
jgi:hypothetical protein